MERLDIPRFEEEKYMITIGTQRFNKASLTLFLVVS
jgi:hypothetical protein